MIESRAASVLIERDGKFLFVKAETGFWAGLWNLPGGRCDSNDETFEYCAVREAKEETGYDVELIKLINEYKYLNTKVNKEVTKQIFLARIVGGELRLQEGEIIKSGWFGPDELNSGEFVPHPLDAVQRYLKN